MSNLFQYNKIVVNSLYKNAGETNANFTINLPSNLQDIKAISFNNIMFPNSMSVWKGAGYGANQNNQFNFIDDVGVSDTPVQITIPEYTTFADGAALATYLQSALNSASAGGYTVSFSLESGARLTISNSSRNFTFDTDQMPKAAKKLGFVGSTSSYTNQTSITGETNINLTRTSIVYIRSNISGNDCVSDQSQNIFDISVVMPLTVAFGSI